MKASDSNSPSVSIIIPSYNCAQYLGTAIASCLRQSVPAKEIIVVDDGSTDDTREVMERFRSEVTVKSIRQEKQGVSVARNTAIAASTSDFLVFLDADDELLETDLERRSEALRAYPDVDVFFSDYYISDVPHATRRAYPSLEIDALLERYAEKEEAGIIRLKKEFSEGYKRGELNQSILWTGAVMLRRSLFDKVGGFRPDLVVAQDHNLWGRSLVAGRAAMIRDHSGAIYYRWRGSVQKYESQCQRMVDHLNEQKEKEAVFSKRYWEIRRKIAQEYITLLYCLGVHRIPRRRAARILGQSISARPGLIQQFKYLFMIMLPKGVLNRIYSQRV